MLNVEELVEKISEIIAHIGEVMRDIVERIKSQIEASEDGETGSFADAVTRKERGSRPICSRSVCITKQERSELWQHPT